MKNIIEANTFTPLYDEIEDRLRVVINYQDMKNRVDFMLTRNFILNLVPTAQEFADQHCIEEPSRDKNLQKESQSQTLNNDIVSKTDFVNLELFRTQEELLLEVNFSYNKTSKLTTLHFKSKNVTASTTLDTATLLQVFNSIKSAIPYIKWGISHNF